MSEQTIISSSSPSEGHTTDLRFETTTNNHTSRTESCDYRRRLDFASKQLVWLIDANINHNSITSLLDSLQQLVNDTKLFDDSDKCEDFLKQKDGTITFLVVSDQFEESFFSRISHMRHIWSIHICHSSANKEHQQRRTELKVSAFFKSKNNYVTKTL
jgi:hypothetical protein